MTPASPRPPDLELDRLVAGRLTRQQVEPGEACLDAEMLASYADEGLSAAARARAEAHLATCTWCRRALALQAEAAGVSTAAAFDADVDEAQAVPARIGPAWMEPAHADRHHPDHPDRRHSTRADAARPDAARPDAVRADAIRPDAGHHHHAADRRQRPALAGAAGWSKTLRPARVWLPLAATVLVAAGLWFALGRQRDAIVSSTSDAARMQSRSDAAAPSPAPSSPSAPLADASDGNRPGGQTAQAAAAPSAGAAEKPNFGSSVVVSSKTRDEVLRRRQESGATASPQRASPPPTPPRPTPQLSDPPQSEPKQATAPQQAVSQQGAPQSQAAGAPPPADRQRSNQAELNTGQAQANANANANVANTQASGPMQVNPHQPPVGRANERERREAAPSRPASEAPPAVATPSSAPPAPTSPAAAAPPPSSPPAPSPVRAAASGGAATSDSAGTVKAAAPTDAAAGARTGAAAPAISQAIVVTGAGDDVLRSPAGSRWWRIRAPSTIEASIDRGASWTVEFSDPTARIVRGVVASNESCWMIGDNGLVLRLRPGRGWVRVTPPSTRPLVSVLAVDDRIASVTDDQGRRYRTTDGGQTWQTAQP